MNRVLIVEDDAAARKGLSELLAGAGLAVTAAGSGAEALTRLGEEAFDVMLLDIWMPQMTGLELLGKVRDKPDLPKVIIMTADDTPETLLMTLRKEAHQFVRKPVQPRALLELVRRTVKEPVTETPIIVLSARPAWVEVLVPCAREIADRIQSYIMNLDVDLPKDTRESMGLVFRELLLDAMEWEGRLDPRRKVRIAYLRTKRMMLYRLADAGYGFRSTDRPFSAAAGPEERRSQSNGHGASQGKLQPGVVMARAEADEVIFNEDRNEIVVIKYLD